VIDLAQDAAAQVGALVKTAAKTVSGNGSKRSHGSHSNGRRRRKS
jgi:hypothetical protein